MSFPRLSSMATHSDRSIGDPAISWRDLLHFPVETLGVLTPFREQVLSYIFRTARGLSDGLLESATVEAVSEPDERDSLHLHLAMTINMDWEQLDELHDQILARLAEWSRDWSDGEQKDYGRWIFFSLTPSRL